MKKITQNNVLVGGRTAGGELSGDFGAVFPGEVTFVQGLNEGKLDALSKSQGRTSL